MRGGKNGGSATTAAEEGISKLNIFGRRRGVGWETQRKGDPGCGPYAARVKPLEDYSVTREKKLWRSTQQTETEIEIRGRQGT